MAENNKNVTKISSLTPEELQELRDLLLETIYADIGRSIVKKAIWVGGAILLALYAFLVGKGYV